GGQGRDIVVEDRGHHAEPQGERPDDAEAVGRLDQVPAPPDVAVEIPADVAQVAELAEAILHEVDVRRVAGDRGGPSERDRDVRLPEGDRGADPVADEADLAAYFLEFLDVIGLVRGEDLSEVAVQTEISIEIHPVVWRGSEDGSIRALSPGPAAPRTR